MELIDLKSLNLTTEESGDIIKFLAQRRGITTKKLLSTIKQNLKCKNNKDLASKSQQKLVKKQQELVKTQLALIKTQHELIKSIKSQQKLTKQGKSQRELIKSQQKLKKQRRLIKSQQPKEIRNHLYNIEYNNKLCNNNNSDELDNNNNSNNSNELDNNNINSNELDNNNNELDNKNTSNNSNELHNNNNSNNNESDNNNNNELDNNNDDFIENVRDLFNIVNYEPILIKTGFDNNNNNNNNNNNYYYYYLEYRSEGIDSLSFEEYLNLIKPYLNDLINNKKDKGEWKLQLSAEISFVSQKPGSDEKHVMYTRSICEELMIGSETEEVNEKLIMSLLQKYHDNLQNKMKDSDFIFNGVNYLFYDLNRISISKGGSYIESPKWLKDKKCAINQKNNDNKCFQYATTLALNFNNIDKHLQRISKIKPFIDNYSWNDINFPAAKKDWNKFELNNKDVALKFYMFLLILKKLK